MFKLRTHVLVVGLMVGMMADYYEFNTIGGVSVLFTWLFLEFTA